MPTRAAQYANEIVSLTMMGLLIVALAAGEVDARAGHSDATGSAMLARQDSDFRHDGE